MDGFEVMQWVCVQLVCGIVILIGCVYISDCVMGFELGVDDYVLKLFELCELVVCVCSILCCWENSGSILVWQIVEFVGWCFNFGNNVLQVLNGEEYQFSILEVELFKVFVSNLNCILQCEKLMGICDLVLIDCSIDVCIFWLCCKFELDDQSFVFIKMVYGVGYFFFVMVNWLDEVNFGDLLVC